MGNLKYEIRMILSCAWVAVIGLVIFTVALWLVILMFGLNDKADAKIQNTVPIHNINDQTETEKNIKIKGYVFTFSEKQEKEIPLLSSLNNETIKIQKVNAQKNKFFGSKSVKTFLHILNRVFSALCFICAICLIIKLFRFIRKGEFK